MKGKWTFIGSLLAVALLALAVGSGQAQGPQPPAPGVEPQGEAGILVSLGTAFTYQGQLKSGGNPVNGTCDFQFTLYDAASGGTSLGTQTKTGVSVTNGLFTIPDLDFGAGAFQGDARWLQIAVRCPAGSGSYTTLTPRQPLTAAPYSLYAARSPWGGLVGVPAGFADNVDNDTTYTAGTGLTLAGNQFSITTTYQLPQSCTNGQIPQWNGTAWTCTSASAGDITGVTAGTGLTGGGTSGDVTLDVNFAGSGSANTVARSDHNHWGQTWSGSGTGLTLSGGSTGLNASGTTYGVRGESASTTGTGVFGHATATSGTTYGVLGKSDSTDGYGVVGYASATSGWTYGVYGKSDSADGIGVYGWATATSGYTYGVYGESASTAGRGVSGYATAASGTTYGVYGWSASTAGRGVYGIADATSGTNYGVYGQSKSTAGRGVYGLASAPSGTNYGVYGQSTSTDGYGVYGTAPTYGVYGHAVATSGTTYGVWGQSNSTAGRGVYGLATATSGTTYGVYGQSASPDGTGVVGYASATSGGTYGVYGQSSSTAGTGVYGYAPADSGPTYGVYGQSNSTAGTGVYGYAPSVSGGHGVYAASGGPAMNGAALYAKAYNGGGIAIWGSNDSTDSTLVLENLGTGDLLRAFISAGELRFRFQNDGWGRSDGGWTSPASDFAEMFPAVNGLEPGDVLVVGADGKLARSTQAYQPTVVGVYSTRPGFVGGQPVEGELEGHIPLAVVGVVPVKASAENGPIRPGDLLVASATPGHAMRAGPNPPQGTVIGKALEGLEKGTGVIQMLVVLQ